jgi:2',3'-cyclic-nucleotide 2'-phosphodiesterase/3'-nucleotidase
VHDASGAPFVAPYTVLTRSLPHGAKVRIGVIGATTPGSMVWDADNLRAAGLTVSDIIPAVRSAVAALRKQKADVIVTVLHSGLNEPATYDTVATVFRRRMSPRESPRKSQASTS